MNDPSESRGFTPLLVRATRAGFRHQIDDGSLVAACGAVGRGIACRSRGCRQLEILMNPIQNAS